MKFEQKIKLGYEIGTGEEVSINPSHLIVTGLTNLSGKSTTLEALISRSGLKAVVFKTKIGEKAFTQGTEVAPFFRDRSDYEFVKSLIEAYSKEKLFLEKGTLMRLCKGSASLLDIKKKVDEALLGKLRGLEVEIYTRLQHYLENLIPQIQYANLSKTLQIYEGINIMNLERFTEEAQALIIQSVADEVLKTMKDVILVIPEAWKFLPQKYNNPCKRVVESFIRQGATNKNFIWLDSQDMAGVDKLPLKQISTWVLGYQRERNEVKHTLDQISLPKKSKPKEDEIMGLKKGHFYLSDYDGVKKVYVQPIWLDDADAQKIAQGKLSIGDIEPPNNLVPFNKPIVKNEESKSEVRFDDSQIKRLINELRIDTFNKFQEFQNMMNKVYELIYAQENSEKIDEASIIASVLQKIPINKPSPSTPINEEEIIRRVIARIPKGQGNVTYEVAPLEKIKKDFLEEAKRKIIENIENMSTDAKKVLKYLEASGKGVSTNEFVFKCFNYNSAGGSQNKRVLDCAKELIALELIKKDTAGKHYTLLKDRIRFYLAERVTTEQEIDQVYNHILMELLK